MAPKRDLGGKKPKKDPGENALFLPGRILYPQKCSNPHFYLVKVHISPYRKKWPRELRCADLGNQADRRGWPR